MADSQSGREELARLRCAFADLPAYMVILKDKSWTYIAVMKGLERA